MFFDKRIFKESIRFGLLLTIFYVGFLYSVQSYADSTNPCEFMNLNSDPYTQIDTGNDPNFERIKQQNNQQLVRECQEYQINKLRAMTYEVSGAGWSNRY